MWWGSIKKVTHKAFSDQTVLGTLRGSAQWGALPRANTFMGFFLFAFTTPLGTLKYVIRLAMCRATTFYLTHNNNTARVSEVARFASFVNLLRFS